MREPRELSEAELDSAQGALSSDPEWRIAAERRVRNAADPQADALFLPEVDDEVLVK